MSGKTTTIQGFYDRISYDPALNGPSDWIIGYLDRFRGVIEKPYSEFIRANDPNIVEGVPFHRIRYFKQISTGKMITREERFRYI